MNVLSIDFDIIMAPVIEYYNNMVPKKDWEQIQNENPGMITPKADLHHFNFIIQLLEKHLNNIDNLYIAFNHKKIIDFLENEESFSIINIDHHHDLGYEPLDEIVEEKKRMLWLYPNFSIIAMLILVFSLAIYMFGSILGEVNLS